MSVEIRAARPEDLDGLVASSAALFAEDAGTRDPAADTTWPHHAGRDVIAAGITDPRRLVLVAVSDGTVVGHLTGVLVDPSVMASGSAPTRHPRGRPHRAGVLTRCA